MVTTLERWDGSICFVTGLILPLSRMFNPTAPTSGVSGDQWPGQGFALLRGRGSGALMPEPE